MKQKGGDMREPEKLPAKTGCGNVCHSPKRIAHQVGGIPASRHMVGASSHGAPCYLGHFRLAGNSKQILVNSGLILEKPKDIKRRKSS